MSDNVLNAASNDAIMAAMRPILPADHNGPLRQRIQDAFDFSREEIDPALDDFARRALQVAPVRLTSADNKAIAGINRMNEELFQFFPGMVIADFFGGIISAPMEARYMGPEEGYCNYIAAERKIPLPLNDLSQFARYNINPVTEEGLDENGNEKLRLKAYLGAPLLTPGGLTFPDGSPIPERVVFGTVWIVVQEVQAWTRDHSIAMRVLAAEIVAYLVERRRLAAQR